MHGRSGAVMVALLAMLAGGARGAGPEGARAGQPEFYVGLVGGAASGSLFVEDSGAELSLASKAADATFGAFAGMRLPVGTGFSAAFEADYQFGDVSVAEASSGALQANAALRDVWTVSVLPTLHFDDKVGFYVRAGVGRGTLAGRATDGVMTTSADEHFTLLRGGVGMSYQATPTLMLRVEYVYLQAQKKDGVQPSTSGVQLGVAYLF